MPAVTDISQITDELFSQELSLSTATKISVAAIFALSIGFSRSITGSSTLSNVMFPAPGEISEFHRAMYQHLLTTPFPTLVQRMAISITNAIRADGNIVKGDTYWHFLVVKIEYRWFAYPAICWFLVLLAVLGTSIMEWCKGRAWWGTSGLPSVMVGMKETVREELVLEHKASLGDKSGMWRTGEAVRMRITEVDEEGELEWGMESGRELGVFGAAFGKP